MQEIKLNLSFRESHENLLRIAWLVITLLFGSLSSAEDNFRLPVDSVSAFVGSDSEFLPVSKAFALNLGLKEAARVEVNWLIEDGYYLYFDSILIKENQKIVDFDGHLNRLFRSCLLYTSPSPRDS